jgi:hypothetical protein
MQKSSSAGWGATRAIPCRLIGRSGRAGGGPSQRRSGREPGRQIGPARYRSAYRRGADPGGRCRAGGGAAPPGARHPGDHPASERHQPRMDTLRVAQRVRQLCFEQSTSPHPDRVALLHGELVDEICQPYLLARVSLPPAFMLRVSAPSIAIGVVPAPQPRQPCPSVAGSGQLLDEGPEDFFGRSSKRIRRHGQRPPGIERTSAAPLLSSFLGLAEPAEQRGASVRATSVSRRGAGDTVRAGTGTRAGAFCRPARTPPPQEDSRLRWRERSPPGPRRSSTAAGLSSTRPQLASFRQLPSDVAELHIEPLRRAA